MIFDRPGEQPPSGGHAQGPARKSRLTVERSFALRALFRLRLERVPDVATQRLDPPMHPPEFPNCDLREILGLRFKLPRVVS